MEGARAQRTGRAHLRVPVDDMIFEIAKRPAGQISVRKAFFVSFCALQKVTRSARDWHRKTAMDGLQERQARATSQIDKTERQARSTSQSNAKAKTKKKARKPRAFQIRFCPSRVPATPPATEFQYL